MPKGWNGVLLLRCVLTLTPAHPLPTSRQTCPLTGIGAVSPAAVIRLTTNLSFQDWQVLTESMVPTVSMCQRKTLTQPFTFVLMLRPWNKSPLTVAMDKPTLKTTAMSVLL